MSWQATPIPHRTWGGETWSLDRGVERRFASSAPVTKTYGVSPWRCNAPSHLHTDVLWHEGRDAALTTPRPHHQHQLLAKHCHGDTMLKALSHAHIPLLGCQGRLMAAFPTRPRGTLQLGLITTDACVLSYDSHLTTSLEGNLSKPYHLTIQFQRIFISEKLWSFLRSPF